MINRECHPGGHYWVTLVDITGLPWWKLLSYPGGHYWGYHPGVLSVFKRKISMGARSSNQLQRLDNMTGYQDSNCNNSHQVTCHIQLVPSWGISLDMMWYGHDNTSQKFTQKFGLDISSECSLSNSCLVICILLGMSSRTEVMNGGRHQMEIFSAFLVICAGNSPVTGVVNSSHKGQWRGALMFFFICAWINGWVNNRETGDLRHHHAHYDITVMKWKLA